MGLEKILVTGLMLDLWSNGSRCLPIELIEFAF